MLSKQTVDTYCSLCLGTKWSLNITFKLFIILLWFINLRTAWAGVCQCVHHACHHSGEEESRHQTSRAQDDQEGGDHLPGRDLDRLLRHISPSHLLLHDNQAAQEEVGLY